MPTPKEFAAMTDKEFREYWNSYEAWRREELFIMTFYQQYPGILSLPRIKSARWKEPHLIYKNRKI